ncbi:MAG: hypothetical protein KC464_28645, partial [Myxococcales bacterium]|nr:hypothetical protein [Myxococcales bacterium]
PVAVLACRSRHDDGPPVGIAPPPDPGELGAAARGDVHPDEGLWRTQEVLECDFAVALPGTVERMVDRPKPTPEVATYMYAARRGPDEPGLLVECTVFPHDMELPPPDELLRGVLNRHRLSLDGLGGGIVDESSVPADVGDTPGLAYDFRFASGKRVEGQMLLIGRQVHDLSTTFDGTPTQHADLDRLLASYVRR